MNADDEHDLKEALTTLCKEVGSLIRILQFNNWWGMRDL